MTTVIGNSPIRKNQFIKAQTLEKPEFNAPMVIKDGLQLVREVPFSNGLSEVYLKELANQVNTISIFDVPMKDISTIGSEAEQSFSLVLDDFLLKIDEIGGTRVGAIVKELAKRVDDENLAEVATRIMKEKPGFLESMKESFLTTFKKASKSDLKEQFMSETRDLLKGKTSALKKTMDDLEKNLKTELTRLESNVNMIESVKEKYREHFMNYLYSTVFILAFLEKSRYDVQERIGTLDITNPVHQSEAKELEAKLECLESRALALQGTLTSLPADDLVISQIHSASITTRQELMTDLPSKFNRIKMTIIKLNSALILKGVQDVNAHSDKIDKALFTVNQAVTWDVVQTASNLAGDNRQEQANRIMEIVNETNELMAIADQGAQNNKKKFQAARITFEEARAKLVK